MLQPQLVTWPKLHTSWPYVDICSHITFPKSDDEGRKEGRNERTNESINEFSARVSKYCEKF